MLLDSIQCSFLQLVDNIILAPRQSLFLFEFFSRLADQMRMLNFPQWFDLLTDIFSKFTIFLQRVKVSLCDLSVCPEYS